MTNKYKWFTLVELIVVIVILAILATIAFMTFSSQSSIARDSKRVTELRELSSAIEKELVTTSNVAIPTNPKDMKFNWCIAFRQGTFWKDTLTSVWKISEIPKDPLYWNEFTYSINQSKSEYEIAWVLENDQTAYINPFIDQAYAFTPTCWGPLAADPNIDVSSMNVWGNIWPRHYSSVPWDCTYSCLNWYTWDMCANSPWAPSTWVKKTWRAVVIGNYNLIMTKTECPNWDNVLLWLPSIISANTTDDLDTQFDSTSKWKTLVYDKLANLPASYENNWLNMSWLQLFWNNTDINTDWIAKYLELWRSVDDTNSYWARKNPERKIDYKCIIQKLSKLYNWVPMTDNSVYKQIADTASKTPDEQVNKWREIYCGYFNWCKSEIAWDNSQNDTCP